MVQSSNRLAGTSSVTGDSLPIPSCCPWSNFSTSLRKCRMGIVPLKSISAHCTHTHTQTLKSDTGLYRPMILHYRGRPLGFQRLRARTNMKSNNKQSAKTNNKTLSNIIHWCDAGLRVSSCHNVYFRGFARLSTMQIQVEDSCIINASPMLFYKIRVSWPYRPNWSPKYIRT